KRSTKSYLTPNRISPQPRGQCWEGYCPSGVVMLAQRPKAPRNQSEFHGR
ncbi:hypothetical protein AVEN_250859-1, partial [Araneus ventricosus]